MADTSTDKKIVVDSFTGGSDGNDLIDCYFKVKNDGTYEFKDKTDHTKCSDISLNSGCSFNLDGLEWTLILTSPCTDTEVNGSWTAVGIDGTDEGGTFQAQAGGGAGEVEDDGEGRKYHIHDIHSDHGTEYGKQLKHCYFRESDDDQYTLHDPDDGVLKSEITSNETFFFKYLSQEWEMTVDFEDVKKIGRGDWKLLSGISDEIDGGTFQAQAGGGGGLEESAYTANA